MAEINCPIYTFHYIQKYYLWGLEKYFFCPQPHSLYNRIKGRTKWEGDKRVVHVAGTDVFSHARGVSCAHQVLVFA